MSKRDLLLGSKLLSQTSVKSKEQSVLSKKSNRIRSYTSTHHGSKFGRSICRFPKQNDPETVLTVATSNSRVIPALFDFKIGQSLKFPDLTATEATESIRKLGQALNILDYEFNYASFWALDILSHHLKELQLDGYSVANQQLFLGWFSYILRCISISGAEREDLFMLLQDMFKKAVNIIEEGGDIPFPGDVKNRLSADQISTTLSTELQSIASSDSNKSMHSKQRSSSKKSSKKSLKSLKISLRSSSKKSSHGSILSLSSEEQLTLKLNVFYKIIEILYEMYVAMVTFTNLLQVLKFADRFMYSVISLAYSSPAITTSFDIPCEFNEIKQPKPEPVVISSPREKSPKGKKSVSKGRKKSKEKGKKKKSSSGGEKTKKSKHSVDDSIGKPDKKKSKSKSRSKSKASTDGSITEASTKSKESKRKASKSKNKGSKTGKEINKEVETKDTDKSTKRKSKGGVEKKRNKSKGSVIDKSDRKDDKAKDTKKEKKDGKSRTNSARIKRKCKKSTMDSSVDGESEVDKIKQAKLKMFARPEIDQMQLEEEKLKTINQFILPLSEAVDEKFVDNLIKTLLPHDQEREEDKETKVGNDKNRRKSSKKPIKSGGKSKKSSVKRGKSKKGQKKK